MGTFKWPLRIASMDGQRAQEIEATVDTGAAFTTLPSNLLRELGIEATGKRGFLLAKGRRVEMDYGESRATIDGDTVTTIVVFGEDDAPPLLGAYTLEGLALAVDGGATPGRKAPGTRWAPPRVLGEAGPSMLSVGYTLASGRRGPLSLSAEALLNQGAPSQPKWLAPGVDRPLVPLPLPFPPLPPGQSRAASGAFRQSFP